MTASFLLYFPVIFHCHFVIWFLFYFIFFLIWTKQHYHAIATEFMEFCLGFMKNGHWLNGVFSLSLVKYAKHIELQLG